MKERVQLNLSVTREQKLALMALAEGHGTSVTKLVLGLIDQGGVGSVPGPSESAGLSTGLPAGAVDERPKKTRTPSQGSGRPLGGSQTISEPGNVPAAIERAAPSGTFLPDPKVGKPRTRVKSVVTVSTCRHGLMRCKVCGTL